MADGARAEGPARTWWRATCSTVAMPAALKEELYSPRGLRLVRAQLELDQRAATVGEVMRRATHYDLGTEPGPIPAVVERAVDVELPPITPEPVLEQKANRMAKRTAITWKGETKTASEWGREVGCSTSGVLHRVRQGRNPDGSERPGGQPSAPAPKRAQKAKEPKSVINGAPPPSSARIEPELLLELAGFAPRLMTRTDKGSMIWVPAA